MPDVPQYAAEAEVQAAELPAHAATVGRRKVKNEDLRKLDNHLNNLMGKLQEAMYQPSGQKDAPTFNATQLAKLCGKSANTMAKHLDRAEKLKLSDGLVRDAEGKKVSAHRSFTLEDTIEWVRHFGGPPYKRKPGQAGAVITVGFFKGGVGKTTLACSLAQGLSLMGYKVLAIDFDPQASMTAMLGVDPSTVETEQTFTPLALPTKDELHRESLAQSIRPTYWSGVDIVAGGIELFQCEFYLPLRAMNAQQEGKQFNFLDVLNKGLNAGVRDEYDFVIIDTPPALSYTTMNAYLAADAILMPIVPEGLSLQSSVQFWDMFCDLSDIADNLTKRPKEYAWLGIVPSKVDHKPATQEMLKWIRLFYKDYVLASEIPVTDAVKTGSTELRSLYDIKKYAGSAKTYERAREAFDRVVVEVEAMTRRSLWNDETI